MLRAEHTIRRSCIGRGSRRLALAAPLLAAWAACCSGCGPSDSQARATADRQRETTGATAKSEQQSTGSDRTPSHAEQIEQLRAAATTLWDARVKEDWAAAYDYLPENIRQRATREEYVAWSSAEEPFITHAYEIKAVYVDGDFGWVELTNTLSMRRMQGDVPRQSPGLEKWQLVRTPSGEPTWLPISKELYKLYPDSPSRRNAAEEARLRERFIESARLREQADWEGLYAMSEPDDRQYLAFEQFVHAMEETTFLEHEVLWVEVIGDLGRVHASFVQRLNDPNMRKLPPKSFTVTERWVPVDGQWYLDLNVDRATVERSQS